MHGGEGERKRRRHMWPVPATRTAGNITTKAPQHPGGVPVIVSAVDSNLSPPNSLLKDGRRFFIGDCALFQAGNSPPFIGIIRWFSPDEQDSLKLGVSRLYRPSEVKLAKGILLEAAPNEVFYSFHKDEISAELLLHPCKVAFLCKGVELPQWVSSFVCRRVYDSADKCLWWLTDQDYIDDRQEEVTKLLAKTREEMHAGVQSGGRSPKQLNGPAQQSKSGTDTPNNNTHSSLSSQVKGKKRAEKGDQGSDSTIKRERSSKPTDDGGESTLRAEIERITEKGALVNVDAVEKLVQLMQLNKGERKIDLAGRILLADVIAATDKSECLGRFVQLKGFSLLDDWLQEAHKGKNGSDGASPKEGDKSVDELLLALLHALDKLPVNLDALQECHVGKSVNHLRGHKNSDIQKKARGLFDAWKKSIDAEITTREMTKHSDSKSTGAAHQAAAAVAAASLTGKPGLLEASSGGGSKRSSGSGETPLKSLVAQHSSSSGKSLSAKSNSGQPASVKVSSMLTTSSFSGSKDFQSKAELALAAIEEKSSSSSQSQNNSQSCSSDHAKSSTSGSTHPGKVSGGSSCPRKSSNGHASSGLSQKDGSLTKSSPLSRNSQSERGSQHGERTGDDHGNNQRLIVRLPNPGRSPARSTSAGCFEESTSQTSPWSTPMATEKVDQIDYKTKLKSDANAESWHSDDLKGTEKLTAVVDEKRGPTEKTGKGSDSKPGKAFDVSMSHMNALVESCAKYSEASASSGGDDSGMNLLASVATGEISKSSLLSPGGSPLQHSPAGEVSMGKVKPIGSGDGALTHVPGGPDDCMDDDDSEKRKHNHAPGDGEQQQNSSDNGQTAIDNGGQHAASSGKEESKDKIVEAEDELPKPLRRKRKASSPITDGAPDSKARVGSPKANDGKHALKSDVGDENLVAGICKSEELVEIASSIPVGRQDLTDEVAGTDAGSVAEDEVKEEKPDFSTLKSSQVGQNDADENLKEAVDLRPCSASANQEDICVASSHAGEVNVARKDEFSPPIPDASAKLDFDLNEGFSVDEASTSDLGRSSSVHLMNLQPFNSSPAPITIAAPAKGPFVPPETLMKSKDEPGWRGSAATSAFRPAEPRKTLENSFGLSISSSLDPQAVGRQPRPPLDIDLNVADEIAVDDVPPQVRKNPGGLDLDLNRLDESTESGQPSVNMLRDFDLNDGPCVEEAGGDLPFPRSQLPMGTNSLPFLPGLRLNNSEMGGLSTWFPPGSSYPAVAIPSFLPERVDPQQPYPIVAAPGSQRMLGSPAGGSPFGGDMYRGPVLSSSPAMTFSPAAAFSYAGFPFGSSFPLASTSSFSYPEPPPGYAAMSSSYVRPYLISLHDGSGGGAGGGGGGGGESSRKWGQQSLDLNAGPGGGEIDGRAPTRPSSVPISQGFVEDQPRLFHGRATKRKEPEGGWDAERFSCK